MKKILLALTIVFTVLTFIGAGYVILSNGAVNAGYAVVPIAWTIVCLNGYRWRKKRK